MKLILALFITMLMVGFISAQVDITLNSISQKDRSGNVITNAQNVGDQILFDVNVYDSNYFTDLKEPTVNWDSSWINCYSRNILDNYNINYKCLLTVTPTMNHQAEVSFKITSRNDGDQALSLGTYDFKGAPFPTSPRCEIKLSCTRYKSTCHKECVNRKCSNVCTQTCAVYNSRTVCTNR